MLTYAQYAALFIFPAPCPLSKLLIFRDTLPLRRLIISTEICKKCAGCCKKYPFVELSENEISLLELATGLHFSVFTNAKGKTGEGYFLQFKENGDCFFLNGNNGGYSCGVYEARPGICKKYPLKPIEKETCAGLMQIASALQGSQALA